MMCGKSHSCFPGDLLPDASSTRVAATPASNARAAAGASVEATSAPRLADKDLYILTETHDVEKLPDGDVANLVVIPLKIGPVEDFVSSAGKAGRKRVVLAGGLAGSFPIKPFVLTGRVPGVAASTPRCVSTRMLRVAALDKTYMRLSL